jgi:hypothetical protein
MAVELVKEWVLRSSGAVSTILPPEDRSIGANIQRTTMSFFSLTRHSAMLE